MDCRVLQTLHLRREPWVGMAAEAFKHLRLRAYHKQLHRAEGDCAPADCH